MERRSRFVPFLDIPVRTLECCLGDTQARRLKICVEGYVNIPVELQPYMGGMTVIK